MNKTPEEIAEQIIDMLGLEFKKKKGWKEPTIKTSWGQKTEVGVKASISRLIEEGIFST